MTPPSPRRNNRQQLLDGALTCVQEMGYARTTARDVVAASGTNLGSIGYHFGGMDALLEEALGQCFDVWTERVRAALTAQVAADPRALLEAVLGALVDSFEELRPMVVSCVEAFPPAIRSDVLRARLAQGYAAGREAGGEMVRQACRDLGIDPPAGAEVLVSVIIALCDGLMLQWLVDPDATPSGAQAVEALALLAPFLTDAGTGVS